MNLKTVLITFATVGLLAAPANALNLVNGDDVEYQITVIEGQGDATSTKHDLEAGGEMTEFCANGCTLQINDGAAMNFTGNEEVRIEDGAFVVSQ
jgi:hypothetical protein